MLALFLVVRMPTITTRNLDEDVKQKLRVLAAHTVVRWKPKRGQS